jgi:hypothetical protein
MHLTTNSTLLLASLLTLLPALALGAVDGVYFHLRRFELFAQAESRSEHLVHTVRAILLLPTIALLYLLEPAGTLLLVAALVIVADGAALFADLLIEQRSRVRLGGIPHAEYVIHVLANGLHAVSLALALASAPASAWSVSGVSLARSPLPLPARCVAAVLLLVVAVTAVQHVLLLHRGSSAARLPEMRLSRAS